jgi:hypothetical protein
MRNGLAAGVALFGLASLSCNQAILTAPTGATINLFANPDFIVAHGGVSVISALVIEKDTATPVADGTVVQFFSNLGRIDAQGKTNDGVARVNLVADSRSGTAKVTAVSGATTPATVDVTIGSKLPSVIIVTAFPQRLTDHRASLITANVFDASGNPVGNVPVIFTVGGATEFMDSQGTPTFTDSNGQSKDMMRTRYDPAATPKDVTVTATVPVGAPPATVVVHIN